MKYLLYFERKKNIKLMQINLMNNYVNLKNLREL
jgi:hypothetical protein